MVGYSVSTTIDALYLRIELRSTQPASRPKVPLFPKITLFSLNTSVIPMHRPVATTWGRHSPRSTRNRRASCCCGVGCGGGSGPQAMISGLDEESVALDDATDALLAAQCDRIDFFFATAEQALAAAVERSATVLAAEKARAAAL